MSRRRPSYSSIVSTLALFVALGGTSYAVSELPAHSVGNLQLRRGAVTTLKVRNGSLTGRDIRPHSVSVSRLSDFNGGSNGAPGADGRRGPTGQRGRRGERGPTGKRGPAGETGSRGPAGSTGDRGAAGKDGAKGDAGPAGPAPKSFTFVAGGTTYTCTDPDGDGAYTCPATP